MQIVIVISATAVAAGQIYVGYPIRSSDILQALDLQQLVFLTGGHCLVGPQSTAEDKDIASNHEALGLKCKLHTSVV
jgi:hypothetical protein